VAVVVEGDKLSSKDMLDQVLRSGKSVVEIVLGADDEAGAVICSSGSGPSAMSRRVSAGVVFLESEELVGWQVFGSGRTLAHHVAKPSGTRAGSRRLPIRSRSKS
jgi:hypothetical protein